MNRVMTVLVALLVGLSRSTAAQSDGNRFQLGVQITRAMSEEFNKTDVGVGVRFSWHRTALWSAETEIGFFPADFPDEPAFSSNRVEGLFGVTVGPRLGRLRPSAKLRPGFVAFRKAPRPFACIAIFPPPLACTLASGDVLFALDLGGAIEAFPTGHTFLRMDLGDRLVRYPATVLDRRGRIRDDAFFGHDVRVAFGGGLRF
jgi:hypothetical protein